MYSALMLGIVVLGKRHIIYNLMNMAYSDAIGMLLVVKRDVTSKIAHMSPETQSIPKQDLRLVVFHA